MITRYASTALINNTNYDVWHVTNLRDDHKKVHKSSAITTNDGQNIRRPKTYGKTSRRDVEIVDLSTDEMMDNARWRKKSTSRTD